MKRKILFALLMGIVTTGIISFTILCLNTDVSGSLFYKVWFESWFTAYLVVIPCILIIGPIIEKIINKIVK